MLAVKLENRECNTDRHIVAITTKSKKNGPVVMFC